MVDYIGRALTADALETWHAQLRSHDTTSALRDYRVAAEATIDLVSAHASGLAQLFAGRPTLVSTLVRDPELAEAALAKGRAIRDATTHAHATTGASIAALVVGTVAWGSGSEAREMPLLMRPVSVSPAREVDTEIVLHDEAYINPVFAAEARQRGVDDALEPLALASMGGKEFDPRPLWNRVREFTTVFGEGLAVHEVVAVGAFDDPAQQRVDDLDECAPLIAGSQVLAAIAGDRDSADALLIPIEAAGVGDRDPFAERGVGDLDDAQFAALDVVATGRSIMIDSPPGAEVARTAAAIAADGAASAKCVAIVSGSATTLEQVDAALKDAGAHDLCVTASGPRWNTAARQLLLSSMTATPKRP